MLFLVLTRSTCHANREISPFKSSFFGVMISVPDLLIYFVSQYLLHTETLIQVWSHFLIPHRNIWTISLENLLIQQTGISSCWYQYFLNLVCDQILSSLTNCSLNWAAIKSPSKLPKKVAQCRGWSFLLVEMMGGDGGGWGREMCKRMGMECSYFFNWGNNTPLHTMDVTDIKSFQPLQQCWLYPIR